jgi:hypothetical protein
MGSNAREIKTDLLFSYSPHSYVRSAHITGAYRATPTSLLETEAFIPPIDVYLDGRRAAFLSRFKGSDAEKACTAACQTIRRRTAAKRGRRKRVKNSSDEAEAWLSKRAARLHTRENDDSTGLLSEEQRVQEEWTRRWILGRNSGDPVWNQIVRPPDHSVVNLHKNLKKAESAVLIQIRTG